jgi:signal transduction histidine kinase
MATVPLRRQLSIRGKIMAGYGMLVAILVAVAVTGLVFVKDAHREFREVTEVEWQTVATLQDLRFYSRKLLLFMAEQRTWSDTAGAALKKRVTQLDAMIGSIERKFERLGTLGEEAGGVAETSAAVVRSGRVLVGEAKNFLLLLQSGGQAMALDATIKAQAETLSRDVEIALSFEQTELAARKESVDHRSITAALTIAIVSLVAVLLATGMGIVISARISRPLRELDALMAQVGSGSDVSLDVKAPNDEVGRLIKSFQQMIASLQETRDKLMRSERLSLLGQVTGTVSHELRNPLAAIRTSIAVIRKLSAGKDPQAERVLDRIDRNIDRCNHIVGDLLEFGRMKDLAREPTAIDTWLNEMLDEQTVPESVTLNRDLNSQSEVLIDGTRFRQVLINLVDNAAQALTDKEWVPPDGRERVITVRTEAAGPHLRLSVIDNGPGIPADKLPKIFEPLFTTKSFGVGLGLPTVHQLVGKHGGTIDVASEVDVGTTFTVWLPRHTDQSAVQAAPAGLAGKVA